MGEGGGGTSIKYGFDVFKREGGGVLILALMYLRIH